MGSRWGAYFRGLIKPTGVLLFSAFGGSHLRPLQPPVRQTERKGGGWEWAGGPGEEGSRRGQQRASWPHICASVASGTARGRPLGWWAPPHTGLAGGWGTLLNSQKIKHGDTQRYLSGGLDPVCRRPQVLRGWPIRSPDSRQRLRFPERLISVWGVVFHFQKGPCS